MNKNDTTYLYINLAREQITNLYRYSEVVLSVIIGHNVLNLDYKGLNLVKVGNNTFDTNLEALRGKLESYRGNMLDAPDRFKQVYESMNSENYNNAFNEFKKWHEDLINQTIIPIGVIACQIVDHVINELVIKIKQDNLLPEQVHTGDINNVFKAYEVFNSIHPKLMEETEISNGLFIASYTALWLFIKTNTIENIKKDLKE